MLTPPHPMRYSILMDVIDPDQWPWLIVLAILYVLTCGMVAYQASRRGRRAVAWFIITLLFTAIPAAILFVMDASRTRRKLNDPERHETPAPAARAQKPKRCPHCGRQIGRREMDITSGAPKCPGCGLSIDEATYA